MLEVTFSCPVCSRMFVRDCPYPDAVIPRHLDALLGTPCSGSEAALKAYLEIPDHAEHMAKAGTWPTYVRRS